MEDGDLDRIARLLAGSDRSQQILELGAGYNPVAPKSCGWQTHVVDHATQDELRVKYDAANVDTGLIEHVDTVWHDGPLHLAVPAELLDRVDIVIASHVLEHIPDLIGFFHSASRLVRAGGALSVALPDRRYCFDCFRPWTTTGAVLEAHRNGDRRHSLRTAFDHMAYSATIGGQIAWGPRRMDKPVFLNPFEVAATSVNSFAGGDAAEYQDYHAWQFTQAGFQLIMLELATLGLTDWQVESLHGPENFEFFVVLRRGYVHHVDPAVLQSRRRNFLLAQLLEVREQVDFMLESEAGTAGPQDELYAQVLGTLVEQNARLAEIAETISWLRAVLSPIRKISRKFRGKS